MKRSLSMLLCMAAVLLVCALVLPNHVQAATIASGTCGENLIWVLDDAGTLTISGEGKMFNDENESPWILHSASIKKVVIEPGVTGIMDGAFSGCKELASVVIPEGVTSISNRSFRGCSNLKHVSLPHSLTRIGVYAFFDCTKLTDVVIPDGVMEICDDAFYGCLGLTSITIPASVETLGRAFPVCENLSSIYFMGDAPRIADHAFLRLNATAYYPAGNTTWTAEAMSGAWGGSITWKPYADCNVVGHSYTDDKDATCDVCGYERQLSSKKVAVYRLYNPYTHEHLLTGGTGERDALISVGWSLDGLAWYAPETGIPVYRLYNPYDDWHTYTVDENEKAKMVEAGWTVDGAISCSAPAATGRPIYRLFNPYVKTNFHLFTASIEERDMLVDAGWILEGIAWYALS